MAQRNVPANNETYESIFDFLLNAGAIEMTVQYFQTMKKEGLEPTLHSMENIVTRAAEFGHSRLAFDLAKSFEADSLRALPAEAWLSCLSSAADALWVSENDHRPPISLTCYYRVKG